MKSPFRAALSPATARRRRRSPRLSFTLGALGVGAFFLPLALFSVLRIMIASGASSSNDPLSRFIRAAHEVRMAIDIDAAGRLHGRPGYRTPSWLDLVVTDRDGIVILSSLPELAIGSAVEPTAVAQIAQRLGPDRSFIAETIAFGKGADGVYYAILAAPPVGFSVDPALPLIIAASFMGMAVIAFLFGALAAAKIAAEVLHLQRAAGRIASGDLDTSVEASGAREIADLAAAMDGMRRALREDLALRARFLAAVSHDLRTPLTSIGGYLEAVEDGLAEDPATLRRYVSIMREKAKLLEGRIAGLIDFARMETEEWRLRFEEVELKGFLGSLALEFLEDAALLGRRLEARLEEVGEVRVLADKALLTRAVENVLSNALRYTPPGGLVRVSSRRVSATLFVDVDDEGPGIPATEREKVFEPFYRGSHAREGEGTGLGLYIARSIVRGHGWELAASETGNGGGRLTFSIPLTR